MSGHSILTRPAGNQESSGAGVCSGGIFNFELPLRTVFDHSSDGVLLTTPDGTVFASNRAASEILGWSEAEICRLGRSGIVDKEDERIHQALAVRERKGIFEGDLIFRHKSGALVEVDVSSKIFPDIAGNEYTLTIFRLKGSRQIRSQKCTHEPFYGNSRSSRVGVAILAPDGLVKPQNDMFYSLLGLEKSSSSEPFPFLSVFASDDEYLEITKHIKSSSSPCFEVVAMVQRPQGEKVQARIIIKPVDANDKNGSFLVFLEDVNDNKSLDRCFTYGEGQFEKFAENIPAAVSIRDEHGQFLFVNKKWSDCFGSQDVCWELTNINELFPPDLSYFVAQTDRICLEQKKALEYVLAVRDRIGSLNHWRARKFPCVGHNGKTLVCVVATNITDQVESEKSLMQLRMKYDDLLNGLRKIYKRMQIKLV